MRRLRVVHLAAALALGWASWCFVDDWRLRLRQPWSAQRMSFLASTWSPEDPSALQLRHFLLASTRDLPSGSRLAFAAPQLGEGRLHFVYLWASYLLPEYPLALWGDGTDLRRLDYVLCYRGRLEHFALTPVRQLRRGWLYRVDVDRGRAGEGIR